MARNRTRSETARCPLTRVVGANEHGIIALSSVALEVGSNFALGLHVSLPDSRQSEFVSAETMVVACLPEMDSEGNQVYRVALHFSEISFSDRDLLGLMAYDEGLIRTRTEEPNLLDLAGKTRLEEAIASISLN